MNSPKPDNLDSEQALGASDAAEGEGSQLCVPVESLTEEPAVGAELPAKVKVSRIENGKAYFDVTEVSGAAVANDTAAEPDEDDMMKFAKKADDEMGDMEG